MDTKTPITPHLLHGQGFQSYIATGGAWWELDGWLIFFNHTMQQWWTPGREDTDQLHFINCWEDFTAFYYKYERKRFEPGVPVTAFYVVVEMEVYK